MNDARWTEILKSDLGKLCLESGASTAKAPKLKEGERRNVTILFADIEGFTAMSEKLDPEDVQLIVDNCFRILTNEIEKYRGYIEKYEGDRIMALFGSLESSERDCERAVRAALGMREKFTEIGRILSERGIRVGIRVGVNAGLVVTGRVGKGRDRDFTVMGDAVNLASRLETAAPAGGILVSGEVRKAAGAAFLYENLGKIDLKGKSGPVQAYAVKGLNPARTERWDRSPFVKLSRYIPREADAELRRAVEAAEGRRGIAAVSIAAPAGTGKSRLVHEFLRAFRNSQGRRPPAFRGNAVATHVAPYGLLGDLLGEILDSPEAEGMPEDDMLFPVIRHLAGRAEADERMQSLDPAALKLEIHRAVHLFFERLAALAEKKKRSPLMVHLDDLQWMDRASCEALAFLGDKLRESAPVFFIWTCRPEFRTPEEWRGLFQPEKIALRPLSEKDCGMILRSALGAELPKRERSLLVKKAAGNPFFLEELVQSLIDDGTLSYAGKKWKLAGEIRPELLPDTIQRILMGRVDKLGRDLKETLAAAAVAGESVPAAVMEAICGRMGLTKRKAREHFRLLESAGFLERGEEISFRHALIRDAVYSAILNYNKKILHEAAARSYEETYGERAALLFHHFSSAGLAPEAARYGLAALDQMMRQYAAVEGLATAAALRPFLSRKEDCAAALEAEAKFHHFLGGRARELECIEALEKVSPERAACRRAAYFYGTGDFRRAKASAADALEKLEGKPADPELRMELHRLMGVACYGVQQHREALDHYRKGLAIAREQGERGAEGVFLNAIGLVHFHSGRPKEAVEFYEKAHALTKEIGDLKGEANALGNCGLVRWAVGEYSRALEELQESHRIFREIGFKKGQAATQSNIGVIFHKLGQYRKALGCFSAALKLRAEIGDRAGEGNDLVNIGEVYQHLADYKKALEYCERGKWLAQEAGSNYLLSESLSCRAVVYRKMGESDPAFLVRSKESATEALSVARTHRLGPSEIKALSGLGRTFWLMGEKEKALECSREAVRLIESNAAGPGGSEEDVYMNHYYLLSESGEREKADQYLRILVDLIESRAGKIREKEYLKSFLEEVRQNRYALRERRKLV